MPLEDLFGPVGAFAILSDYLFIHAIKTCESTRNSRPLWGPGGEVKNVSSVSPVCRKRRLNGAVSWNNRIKRLVQCQCLDGHFKEPYEKSMALGARP